MTIQEWAKFLNIKEAVKKAKLDPRMRAGGGKILEHMEFLIDLIERSDEAVLDESSSHH